jgi:small redox-active disulfide protein 2
MKIEILGMGCPKCKKLYEAVQSAAKELNVQPEIDKIEDIQKIVERGVMTTPAILIDGEIKAAGRIPAPDEIKKWISK